MKQIAFFDFDGTITTNDSLLEFIKYQKGVSRFYLGFLINSPFLLAYKMGIISNQWAKERVLTFFFRKMTSNEFQKSCNDFARIILPGLIRPKALVEIKKLQAAGVEVVVVSASPENWVQQWCESETLFYLATRLEYDQGLLTGRINGFNCHGEEKVRRIREAYDLNEYSTIYGYGDTKGDKFFLKLVTLSFYKPFR